jgi:IS30 family transposase
MLTQEDDVEIHALARRGWSVSAIARHTGRDRKTVRRDPTSWTSSSR